LGILKGRDYLGDVCTDGIILRPILNKYGVRMCTEFNSLRIGSSGGAL
jgi:hypothetical protein